MPGNRRWTPAEDEEILHAAYLNAYHGRVRDSEQCARLLEVSQRINRSYGAVRRRAVRIRALSYRFMSRSQWGMRYEPE